MHESTRLIAIDWGTSSARTYALDANGTVVSERNDPLGIQRIADGRFADALATLCGGAIPDGVPLLASGMIGSRQGWVEAPYCACPAGFSAIAAGLVAVIGTNLRIVPGLICRAGDGTPDVMRGEETQIFGALAEDDATPRVIVLPGTHCKWAIVRNSRVETFATFMTGELYAVLRAHSILGRLAMDTADDASLARGVRASLRDDAALCRDLFSARTLALTGALASEGVADYLSGVLLGAEIAAARRWLVQQQLATAPVTLIGDAKLCARYRQALEVAGVAALPGPVDAAARGLWKIAVHSGLLQR
jgi:2-dehydro-3-deoxygalactonokinase